MTTALQIPAHELDELGCYSSTVKSQVFTWLHILEEYNSAENKGTAVQKLAIQYAGKLKISKSTLYRKKQEFETQGWQALVNRAQLSGKHKSNLPEPFVDFWQGLCMDFQRNSEAAYRSLFLDHLQVDKVIPGYGGSWRSIWQSQRPGYGTPEHCPYIPYRVFPHSWSARNLARKTPDNAMLAAARIGGKYATMGFAPLIPTTRYGLKIGQIKVVDDMMHDHYINFVGNKGMYRPLELGAVDLFTGHYSSYGVKPIRELDDLTKEHIRKYYMRALLVHMLCVEGYHPDGCCIHGEHATATLDKPTLEVLSRIAPEVSFQKGTLFGEPLAKGLYCGTPGGNPRWKTAVESTHNLRHNELAMLPGQTGKDRDHSPEHLSGLEKENTSLIRVCTALQDSRPDLLREMAMPVMLFERFTEFLHLAYERINDRTWHNLEGFEAAGLVVQEYRMDPTSTEWLPMSLLEEAEPRRKDLTQQLIFSDPEHLINCRAMSPREAREKHKHELVKLPISFAPQLLGPEFGIKATVTDRLQIQISDPDYKTKKHTFTGCIRTTDGSSVNLARGQKVIVHLLSPIDDSFAFISDQDGNFLGAAPAYLLGTKEDMETLHRNLGLRSQALALEKRKLESYGAKKQRERDAELRHNLETLGIDDPVAAQELKNEISKDAKTATHGHRSISDIDDIYTEEKPAFANVQTDDEPDLDSIY